MPSAITALRSLHRKQAARRHRLLLVEQLELRALLSTVAEVNWIACLDVSGGSGPRLADQPAQPTKLAWFSAEPAWMQSPHALYDYDGVSAVSEEEIAQPFQILNRWSATALSGGGLTQGDPTILTWSIADDGANIPGFNGEAESVSSLIAFLDSIRGAGPGGDDLTQRPWFSLFSSAFARMSAVAGLTYVYEPNDDAAAFSNISATAPGAAGMRGDIRIGGHFIDGQSGSNVLAYNFFPNNGEMVLDTGNTTFYSGTFNNSVGFRNVVMHENGHGVGLSHVESSNAAFLMEPFISTAFDGPQLDDVLALQRNYGDVLEKGGGNNTSVTATDLGAISIGQTIRRGTKGTATVVSASDTDFVSIDDESDVDFFQVAVPANSVLSVTLTPRGAIYLQGPQGGTQTTFNAAAESDLSLQVMSVDGSTVLQTANAAGLGGVETLSVVLGTAGTYLIRVSGATTNKVQLYGLDVTAVPLETSVSLSAGSLIITDINGGTSHDSLTIMLSGANVRVSDPANALWAGAGATQVNANTVEAPLAVVTGNIQVHALGGNDSLTLALAGGDFIPTGGVVYDGGDPTTSPGDKLLITGGSQGTVTYNYSSSHDGSVVMSNFGTVFYAGLEPIVNTGSAKDVIFNLPVGPNAITLGDDGAAGNGLSRLSGATLAKTDFANPAGTLTIHRFDAADALTIRALPDFNAGLIIGSDTSRFGFVHFDGAVTLAANQSLLAYANQSLTVGGALTTSGSGSVSLVAASSIQLAPDGSVSTAGAPVILQSNNIEVSAAASITSGIGDVALRAETAGWPISLGAMDSATALGLTDAELDRITAGVLLIGDVRTLNTSFTDIISPANYQTLSIESGAVVSASGGFESEISSPAVLERLVVNGPLVISAGAVLSVVAVSGYVPAQADSFTVIENRSSSPTSGNFAGQTEGSLVTIAGVKKIITYTGGPGSNDIVLLPAVNRRPAAQNDAYATPEDTVLAIDAAHGVLLNDADLDLDKLSVSLQPGGAPQHGTLSLHADGSFIYVPEADFFGTDSFSYVASDGQLAHSVSNVATVTLTITAVNDPPIAVDDTASTDFGVAQNSTLVVTLPAGPRGVGVLANDTDLDSQSLTVVLPAVATTAHGLLNLQADGTFTYTPDPGFVGVDSFSYRVSDGAAESNPAVVTITVTPAILVTITAGLLGDQLVVTGTSHHDVISVDQVGSLVRVLDAGVERFSFPAASVNSIYLIGDVGDDQLTVSESLGARPSTLQGDRGNDRLQGGSGRDLLIGGAGVDSLDGGAGDDTIVADANDLLSPSLRIWGGSGSDLVDFRLQTEPVVFDNAGPATGRFETIFGGRGDDFLSNAGGTSAVIVVGFGGDDVLIGGDGDDYLDGEDGDDTLVGNAGNDTLIGFNSSTGNPAASGVDKMLGGSGNDRILAEELDVNAPAAVVLGGDGPGVGTSNGIGDELNLEAITTTGIVLINDMSAGLASGIGGFEIIKSGGGNDVITVTNATAADGVYLVGGGGDDFLIGGSANDALQGGAGNDRLVGLEGADTFVGDVGFDTVDYSVSPAPAAALAGFPGIDGVVADLRAGAFSLGSSGGHAQGDRYLADDVEAVIGTPGNDYIIGNDLDNRLEGEAGDDTIIGRQGNDELHGGAGRDTLIGSDGVAPFVDSDSFDGGAGDDHIYADAADLLDRPGLMVLGGPGAADALDFFFSGGVNFLNDFGLAARTGGFEQVFGSSASDRISTANSLLSPGLYYVGRGGDDFLVGGNGNDTLNGGDGNDTLVGAAGADTLIGGPGLDSADLNLDQGDISFDVP